MLETFACGFVVQMLQKLEILVHLQNEGSLWWKTSDFPISQHNQLTDPADQEAVNNKCRSQLQVSRCLNLLSDLHFNTEIMHTQVMHSLFGD